jgi:hypothetical protein
LEGGEDLYKYSGAHLLKKGGKGKNSFAFTLFWGILGPVVDANGIKRRPSIPFCRGRPQHSHVPVLSPADCKKDIPEVWP